MRGIGVFTPPVAYSACKRNTLQMGLYQEQITVHPNSMFATNFPMIAITTKMNLLMDSRCATSSKSLGQHLQILHCTGRTADSLVVDFVIAVDFLPRSFSFFV